MKHLLQTRKAIMRRFARSERKMIDRHLENAPVINGYEILHEHRGQWIIFSAWKGEVKTPRNFSLRRVVVLNNTNVYKTYAVDLAWLTEEN